MPRYCAARLAAAVAAPLLAIIPVSPADADEGDVTPPTAPSNLRVESLSFTRVTLAWDESTDDSGWLMYEAEVQAPTDRQAWAASEATKTFTGLAQGLTYTATVVAVDGARNRSARVTVEFTTPVDTSAPTTPTNLRPVELNGALDSIAWDPANDDSDALTYDLFSGDNRLFTTTDTGVSAFELTYVWCVVQPGETHTLTVQARDGAGNGSGRSSPITVTFPF